MWIYVSSNKYTTVTGRDKRRGILQLKRMKLTTLLTYGRDMAIEVGVPAISRSSAGAAG